MSRVLVTGGAGFMGSQLVRSLAETGRDVVVFDKLTYAGNRAFLEGVPHTFVRGDVCDEEAVRQVMKDVDAVVHMAAESHVARSLTGPDAFLQTNVFGTRVMLDAACRAGVDRFIHISTDEVFGQAPHGVAFGPESPMRPGNAYAASKVGAEGLVHAWRHTHGYPAAIVRCTNNYGPRQHPEKAIPCWILSALGGGSLPVHGEGTAIRDWLFVEDFARGIVAGLNRWQDQATWHFAGQQHRENRRTAGQIASILGAPGLAFGPDRQGQDSRYALNDMGTRAALDWAPQVSMEDGLHRTIEWYREHQGLWDGDFPGIAVH
jgi:dTDP-glucose 4,6-dehydratase